MSFALDLIVPSPTTELTALMCTKSRLTRVTESGLLVIRLRPNRELSCSAYPNEWADAGHGSSLTRFSPDFFDGTVHTIYNPPVELTGWDYQPVLQASEASVTGVYCQIVTKYSGGRAIAYRRETCILSEVGHASASVFSAPELAIVRYDVNARRQRKLLTIHRADVARKDGRIVVTEERIFYTAEPDAIMQSQAPLPEGLVNWEPALSALKERLSCRNRSCQGHYHL